MIPILIPLIYPASFEDDMKLQKEHFDQWHRFINKYKKCVCSRNSSWLIGEHYVNIRGQNLIYAECSNCHEINLYKA